jgi:hypothetical protein
MLNSESVLEKVHGHQKWTKICYSTILRHVHYWKLQNVHISFTILFVTLSVCYNSKTTKWIFMLFDIWEFY